MADTVSGASRSLGLLTAALLAEYARCMHPLATPAVDGVYRFTPLPAPLVCYRADAGFTVHVKPDCRR